MAFTSPTRADSTGSRRPLPQVVVATMAMLTFLSFCRSCNSLFFAGQYKRRSGKRRKSASYYVRHHRYGGASDRLVHLHHLRPWSAPTSLATTEEFTVLA